MDKAKQFVIWLDGYLDAIGADKFNISKTNVIKSKLYHLFDHEVEKMEQPKKSLEELGDEHGFNVNQGFPNSNNIGGRGISGEEYKC